MSLPRPLAWVLLLSGFFLSGLLRQWHHRAGLSLLTLLLILIVFLLYRSGRPGSTESRVEGRVEMNALLPFLVLVVGEKWFSLVFVDRALGWIPRLVANDDLADATYRGMTGLALLAVCLGGALLFRPLWPTLRRLLAPAALGTAAVVLVASLALLYGGLFAFLHLIRGQLPSSYGYYADPVLAIMLLAQVVRAVSEELYFRGLLQEALVPFLATMGVASRRRAKMLAIGLVSLVFVLEHTHLEADAPVVAREMTWVVFYSLLFGLTLTISRSLYLAMGFHFVVDLFLLRGGLVFIDLRDGAEIFQPRDFVLLHAVLFFVVLFAVTGHRRRARRRALAEPAAATVPGAGEAPPAGSV